MRLKHILYTIALCCLFSVATAKAQISKEIMTVLDNTSASIKKCGNVKATFTATQFNKKEPQGSTNGMVCISGNKDKEIKPTYNEMVVKKYIDSINVVVAVDSILRASRQEETVLNNP